MRLVSLPSSGKRRRARSRLSRASSIHVVRKVNQDIDVISQAEKRLTESLSLLNRELELTRRLYAQKVVPEIEMLRLDRQASEMRGQLAEAQSKIINIRTAFRSQADEDLAKSRGDLAVLDENIKSAQDRVARTELKSPVHGIVNKINVTTVGAVVQPGANLDGDCSAR